MDIPSISSLPTPGLPPGGGSPSSLAQAVQAGASAAASSDPGSGTSQTAGGGAASTGAQPSTPPAAAAAVPAGEVHKAVDKLNQQLAQTGNGATLKVGLDSDGQHPGQVLVELSDPATKQVYFKRYVPTEQVTQASEPSSPGGTGQSGVLVSTKA
jgi:hypothetical protein